jgi:hypothetical protein
MSTESKSGLSCATCKLSAYVKILYSHIQCFVYVFPVALAS